MQTQHMYMSHVHVHAHVCGGNPTGGPRGSAWRPGLAPGIPANSSDGLIAQRPGRIATCDGSARRSRANASRQTRSPASLLEEASARGEVMAGRSKRKAALNSGLVHEDASKQAKVSVPDEDDDEEAEFEF